MGRSRVDVAEAWGARLVRGKLAQSQFLALFWKNGRYAEGRVRAHAVPALLLLHDYA